MLRIFPLGGLGEVGMNCLALEQRGQILLVDCGVTFDNRNLGVDVVHADFSMLDALDGHIVGLVLTHGHEDHLGAVPYFLQRHDVPVWGPPYALGLLRHRAREHEILSQAHLIAMHPRQLYEVGSFLVEPIRVTHSIADATALAITTDEGTVVHTGDFKFDPSPPDGEMFDVERFRQLSDAGVSLLFSDSTNIDALGPTGSESDVGDVLHKMIAEAEGAVVVGLFASNVHRLRILGEIASKTNRFLVPLGRSVRTHSTVATETGYLRWGAGQVLAPQDTTALPRNRILAVATGTQAEPHAALARLSRDEFPEFRLRPDDTVVLSSRVIPGNEPQAFAVMANLMRLGAKVRSWGSDRGVHVSGHAHREEQQRMLELVRPRHFIPVHGTLHHLSRHRDLAKSVGLPSTLVLENGDIAELSGASLTKTNRRAPQRVHRFMARPIAPTVLKERLALGPQGVVVVSLVLDASGKLITKPQVRCRGVLDPATFAACSADASRAAARALEDLSVDDRQDDATVEETARLAVRRVVAQAVGYKPVTLAVVHRVA